MLGLLVGLFSWTCRRAVLGLVRLCWITPGIVPANQNLYKLEKQSG
jgi:hypothetical protein